MRRSPFTLLPPNSTQFEFDLEEVMARIGELPVNFERLWNPAHCPKEFLPWLAWTLSVDLWRPWWTEKMQREIIAESRLIHWKKGTPWAVKRLLELAGAPDVELVEWWQLTPRGEPYTFCAHIRSNPSSNPYELDPEQYATIRRLIEVTKPTRADYCVRVQAEFGNEIADNGENHSLALASTTNLLALAQEKVVIPRRTPTFGREWVLGCGFANDTIVRPLAEPRKHIAFDPLPLGVGSTFSSEAATRYSMDAVPTLEFDGKTYIGASCQSTTVTHRSMDAVPTLEFESDDMTMGSGTTLSAYTRLSATPVAQNEDFSMNYVIFSSSIATSMIRMNVLL